MHLHILVFRSAGCGHCFGLRLDVAVSPRWRPSWLWGRRWLPLFHNWRVWRGARLSCLGGPRGRRLSELGGRLALRFRCWRLWWAAKMGTSFLKVLPCLRVLRRGRSRRSPSCLRWGRLRRLRRPPCRSGTRTLRWSTPGLTLPLCPPIPILNSQQGVCQDVPRGRQHGELLTPASLLHRIGGFVWMQVPGFEAQGLQYSRGRCSRFNSHDLVEIYARMVAQEKVGLIHYVGRRSISGHGRKRHSPIRSPGLGSSRRMRSLLTGVLAMQSSPVLWINLAWKWNQLSMEHALRYPTLCSVVFIQVCMYRIRCPTPIPFKTF